jgi:hypothetical protein
MSESKSIILEAEGYGTLCEGQNSVSGTSD